MMKALPLAAALAALAAAGAAVSADHIEQLPEDPAKVAVVAVCTACHDATEITTRRMNATQWDFIVSKMIDLGATPTDTERAMIVAYLPKYFGPPPVEPAEPAATNAPLPGG